MFKRSTVSPLVRRYADDRGWFILSVCQPAHLFRRDIERRHSRVADPRDPWQADLGNCQSFLESTAMRIGIADTPDAAVLAAIPSDLRAALRRCEIAVDDLREFLVDNLRDCLQK